MALMEFHTMKVVTKDCPWATFLVEDGRTRDEGDTLMLGKVEVTNITDILDDAFLAWCSDSCNGSFTAR